MRRTSGSEKKGGRKPASLAQPELVPAIAAAVAEQTAGSPVDPEQQWTNRSSHEIASELQAEGLVVCANTVRRILHDELHLGRRQAVKSRTHCDFAQRNEQFENIARLRNEYLKKGWPVLSIDTKKKELLGNFFRAGRAYTNGQVSVNDHDFPSYSTGKLVPYGVYDVARNEALMYLSLGADTSEMACDGIWRWWQRLGREKYRDAEQILLLCDCGGSNGYRQHRFKEQLHRLACRFERPIRVAHYPPGCSKYNPIEHRLFCHVTRALQATVLTTVELAKRLIARTHTTTGLRVLVEVARKTYLAGEQVADRFFESWPIRNHPRLPELNYTALNKALP